MNIPEQVTKLLEKTGLPYAFYAFPTKTASYHPPAPPFVVYLIGDSDNFCADGKVYAKITTVYIELYTESLDPEQEQKVERVLTEADIPWECERDQIPSERMHRTTYYFDLCEETESEE